MSFDAFLQAMAASGIRPVKALQRPVGGQLLRFRAEGDKPGRADSWCVYHAEPRPAGAFGSWRTGQSETWRGCADTMQTPAQRAEFLRALVALQRQRETEQLRARAAAAAKAARLWRTARPATGAHPYLQAKGVPAYGVRQLRDMLLVPLRDAEGRLHSLQFIGADGSKRFLTGGRIAGCYFGIGRPVTELLLGEGLATCSTLRQATGSAVAVCFSAGNLEPVARALRAKFPRLRLVICADDDRGTPGNPGMAKARAAAKAVGALLAAPRFDGAPS